MSDKTKRSGAVDATTYIPNPAAIAQAIVEHASWMLDLDRETPKSVDLARRFSSTDESNEQRRGSP